MLRTVLALAAAALALAAAPASAPAAVDVSQSPLETSLLQELNKIRTSHGLRPLVASAPLARAADAHATSMGRLGYFSHTSADGTSFDQAFADETGETPEAAAARAWDAYGRWTAWIPAMTSATATWALILVLAFAAYAAQLRRRWRRRREWDEDEAGRTSS